MATFNCNQAQLVNNAKDYRSNVISPHAQKALMAYAKVLLLASFNPATSATDYRSNYPQLFIDASNATLGIDTDSLQAAYLSMAILRPSLVINANQSAVNYSTDINAMLLQAKALIAQTDWILDRVLLFLECQINAAMYN